MSTTRPTRQPTYNPLYPDRVPARIKVTYLPKPHKPDLKTLKTVPCDQCGQQFRAYRLFERDTPTGRHQINVRRHHRRFCSDACARQSELSKKHLQAAARMGMDPDLIVTGHRRTKTNTPAYLRVRRLAREARLVERFMGGIIRPADFRHLTLHSATIAVLTFMTKPDIFNPHQAARLRARIYDIVEKSLSDVSQSLSTKPDNTRVMSPSQVALFKALLGKVLPDLNASYTMSDRRSVPANEMSREDLERLANGDPTLDIEVIEPVSRRPPIAQVTTTPANTPNPTNQPITTIPDTKP